MISVVTTNDTAVMSNPYPGMNLAEACSSLLLETNEIVNNLQMDLLLNEHTYLYENATEITYVNEDGSDNEHAKSVKEKIINAFKTIGAKISELFDKAAEWVREHVDAFITELKKRTLSKSHFDKAAKAFAEVHPDGIRAKGVSPYSVDYAKFQGEYANNFDYNDDIPGVEKVYEKYVTSNGEESDNYIDNDDIKKAGEAIFNKDTVIKDIQKAKKAANKQIQMAISQVKSAKGDDMAEQLDKLSKKMKLNSKIASESVKVYHAYIKLQLGIIKAVFNDADVKKAIKDAAPAERKEAIDNAKAKTLVGKEKAKQAVEDAPGKVADAAKKTGKKFADAFKRDKTAKKDSVKESADVYDGKFFRV